MECRWPQEIHLDVVWRQVIARGQPRLVELHGPVGGGEQPAAQPDFHMSDGRDDADLVAWRHDEFNGSGDTTIPFVEGIWLMPADLEQFADGNGAPRRLKKGVDDEARYLPFCKFWPRVGNAVVVLHAVANRTIDLTRLPFLPGAGWRYHERGITRTRCTDSLRPNGSTHLSSKCRRRHY